MLSNPFKVIEDRQISSALLQAPKGAATRVQSMLDIWSLFFPDADLQKIVGLFITKSRQSISRS